jgi:hypothetical protein
LIADPSGAILAPRRTIMSADEDFRAAMQYMDRRKQAKTERYRLDLQTSERTAASIAGQIYAAYVGRGCVDEASVDAYVARSVIEAVKICYHVEQWVEDKEEAHEPS